MFKFFDSHTHIGNSDFNKDRDEVIKRAFDSGIGIIEVGNDKKSSTKVVELAKKYPDKIWATVGCHPHHIEEFDYNFFKKLAQEPEVVAIGECGLDYFRIKEKSASEKRQKDVFIKHIELANEVNKPLMIHCRSDEVERASPQNKADREANNDLLDLLKANKHKLTANAGVMHFFSGNGAWDNVQEYLNLGFYISFSGVITFPKYSRNKDIKKLPLNKILIETDAPYAAPVPYRGKRNEPSYITETAKKMAEIKNIPLEELNRQIINNIQTIFKIRII